MPRYELELDGGNTQLKYRCVGAFSEAGRIADSAWESCFTQLFKRYGAPAQVRFAAVWRSERKERLAQLLVRLGAPTMREACVQQDVLGVRVAYAEPERLGVDRWLAMLAARSLCPDRPVLVVDCGTAVTLDYLLADGLHQGGYIVPGLRLNAEVLAQQTDRIGSGSGGWVSAGFADNTADAVYRGAVEQLCALISCSLRQRCAVDTRLLLTGGDAAVIAEGLQAHLAQGVDVVPELVLDGLRIALPE